MSPLAGTAKRGHEHLAKWLDHLSAQIETDTVLTMDAEDVRQLLVDVHTAGAHAASVFQTIRGLRPDVKIPEIR